MGFDQLVEWAERHYQDMKVTSQTSTQEARVNVAQVSAPTKTTTKTWSDVVKGWKEAPNPPVQQKGEPQPRTAPTPAPRASRQSPPPQQQKKRSGSRSRRSPKSPSGQQSRAAPQQNKWCSFCGTDTHTLEQCYVFNKICSICKSKGHMFRECPQRRQREEEQPRGPCPICKKTGHLGRDCSLRYKTHQRPDYRSSSSSSGGSSQGKSRHSGRTSDKKTSTLN